jgi:glucosamine--fructose-6-phosphate aminotransferase (isomerizing)
MLKLKKLQQFKDALIVYIGRGYNFQLLGRRFKVKRDFHIHAEGYPAAEMKHGPIALMTKCRLCCAKARSL